jgi:hypothetical protein
MHSPLKIPGKGTSVSSSRTLQVVIPAWSAGIQFDMDVSGGILANLDAGNPCRHDDDLAFHVLRRAQDHDPRWQGLPESQD